MKIAGLDLSLSATGAVLLRDGQWSAEDAQLVVWPKEGEGRMTEQLRARRLDYLEREIMSVIQSWQPDLVAVEGYSFGSTGNALFNIGELGGVIRLSLLRARLPYEVISVGDWRRVLCGNGAMAKERVRLELWKRYEVDFPSLDVLEAWAVAMCQWRRCEGLDEKPAKVRRAGGQPKLRAVG